MLLYDVPDDGGEELLDEIDAALPRTPPSDPRHVEASRKVELQVTRSLDEEDRFIRKEHQNQQRYRTNDKTPFKTPKSSKSHRTANGSSSSSRHTVSPFSPL